LLTTFHTLRQQQVKAIRNPFLRWGILLPAGKRQIGLSGRVRRYRGLHIEPLVKKFEKDHDDYNALMAKALADRLAEGLAELMHQRARIEWGFGKDENLSHADLTRER